MKLAVGFPDIKADFFNLLSEYIVKENFTSERLEYAIDYILRTFRYKQLTLADILSIDNRVKVYSYSDMLDYINDKGGGTSDFSLIRISGQAFWVTNQDKARYRLPDEI